MVTTCKGDNSKAKKKPLKTKTAKKESKQPAKKDKGGRAKAKGPRKETAARTYPRVFAFNLFSFVGFPSIVLDIFPFIPEDAPVTSLASVAALFGNPKKNLVKIPSIIEVHHRSTTMYLPTCYLLSAVYISTS